MEVRLKDRGGETSKLSEDYHTEQHLNHKHFHLESDRMSAYQKHSTGQKKDRHREESWFDIHALHKASSDETMSFSNGFSGELRNTRSLDTNGISSNVLKEMSYEYGLGKFNVSKKQSACKCGLCNTSDNPMDSDNQDNDYSWSIQNERNESKNTAKRNDHDSYIEERQSHQTKGDRYNTAANNQHHLERNQQSQQTSNGLGRYSNRKETNSPLKKASKNHIIEETGKVERTDATTSRKKKNVTLPRKCSSEESRKCTLDIQILPEHSTTEESQQSDAKIVPSETSSIPGVVESTDSRAATTSSKKKEVSESLARKRRSEGSRTIPEHSTEESQQSNEEIVPSEATSIPRVVESIDSGAIQQVNENVYYFIIKFYL